MRVAYLVNQYPRTSHSFVRREIHALEAGGAEVLRFSLRPVDEELPTEDDREEAARTRAVLDEGVVRHALAVLSVGVRRPIGLWRAALLALRMGGRSDRGILRNLAYLGEACILERWTSSAGADHLHAHFGTNAAAVAALCHEIGGPPFSFTVHGPEEFDHPRSLSLPEKIGRAAFVVAISSYGRAQLFRWARRQDWEKIRVVRCGVDDALLRAPPTPVPDVPRLVCVARLGEQKGHFLLVDAVARLAMRGVKFELILAGDGPLRGAIEELIERRGLSARVRVAGWMSGQQVREHIQGARALVLPSFAEGLPVVLMEALALGRPVIATAVAGVPELVEHGVSGWVVPAGSVNALADAMLDALQTPTQRLDDMGRAGAARVARRHDVAREARKLASLFRTHGAAEAGAMPPDDSRAAVVRNPRSDDRRATP